jgi:NDP-sugar pyrophosphorylase family protein
MSYILHEIEWAKRDIETAERKIEEEKRQKLENWETAIRVIEDDLQHTKYIIQKEEKEKDKLLNHENEIIRKDAQARYDEYLKSDDKIRRRAWI